MEEYDPNRFQVQQFKVLIKGGSYVFFLSIFIQKICCSFLPVENNELNENHRSNHLVVSFIFATLTIAKHLKNHIPCQPLSN